MTLQALTTDPFAEFRSGPERGEVGYVDREKKALMGATIARLGPAKGYRVDVDQTSLDQIVNLINASPKGAKGNFTHGQEEGDAIGTFLGRWRNARISGDKAIGDFFFSKAAFKSPRGDLGGYLMDLGEDDAEAFGASLRADWEPELRQKLRSAATARSAERFPARFSKLTSVDFVDDPAAADGIFRSSSETGAPEAAEVEGLLDRFCPDALTTDARDLFNRFLNKKGLIMSAAAISPSPAVPAATDSIPASGAPAPAPAAATPPAPAPAPALAQPAAPLASPAAQDVAAIEREAMLRANKRASEIISLCQMGGVAEKAEAFIASPDVTVESVREQVTAAWRAKNAPVGAPGAPARMEPADDHEATFRAEYAKNPFLAKSGLSAEDYVQQRRFDLDLEELKPASLSKRKAKPTPIA
jgi:hypothetical protein